MSRQPKSACPMALSNQLGSRLWALGPKRPPRKIESIASRCWRLLHIERLRTDQIAKALNITEAEVSNALRRAGERRVLQW
jgi:hypothetical protein